jgi:hypothetical protein
MSQKIWDVISTTLMGLGGLALGGFLVINHQVAIGSALIGAVSSAWFLHTGTSAAIGSLTSTQATTITQLLSQLSQKTTGNPSASGTGTAGSSL